MALNIYPLDPTGKNVNNLVRGEPVVVATTGIRVAALKFGSFYAKSLAIRDVATNTLLRPDQFYATWRYSVPTSQFKQDVCGLIVILDPGVGNNLLVDYQVVGGVYSESEAATANLLGRRAGTTRSTAWRPLLSRPSALTTKDFTDDEFGFARLENVLDKVARTMINGSPETQDAIYAYVDNRSAPYLSEASPAFANELKTHVEKTNPHPSYLLKSELADVMPKVFSAVRRPKNFLPLDRSTSVALKPNLEAGDYLALYGVPQAKMQVQVASDSAFTKLALDQTINSAAKKYAVPINLVTKTKYFWRVRYQNTEAQWSEWSFTTSFTTV